jgi:hypothetical protein
VTRSHLTLAGVVALLGVLLLTIHPGEKDGQASDRPPANDSPPRGYVAYRASSPITIDGNLDDAAWAAVPWSEPFRDIEGDKKPDPPLKTRMKMVWDDKALYIAAELEEPHVWATLTKHDSVIFHDPDFEVFLDPDADSHNYCELELNALNTTWDLLLTRPYKDGGTAVNAWEIIGLKTGVHVNGTINDPRDSDRGWTVEIAWPWEGLKELSTCPVPPRDGDQWRINFSRVEWDIDIVEGKYQKFAKRPEHNWVWSPQGVVDMHRPERWGIVQFSTAKPGMVEFHGDPSQPARDYLHRVYYAQKDYSKEHDGRFSTNLPVAGSGLGDMLSNPYMGATQHTFEASVGLKRRDGQRERWQITHDARIERVDPPPQK